MKKLREPRVLSKKNLKFCCLLAAFYTMMAVTNPCIAQYLLDTYANHDASVQRKVISTRHFDIVYDSRLRRLAGRMPALAEQIYTKYQKLLGRAPDGKIILYVKGHDRILSAGHALQTGSWEPLWKPNPFLRCLADEIKWKYLLRYEIAYAFQQALQASKLGLWQALLLSMPAQPLWSAGLPSYLAVPDITFCDIQWLRHYWNMDKKAEGMPDSLAPVMLGRSQLRFFTQIFSPDYLHLLYSTRQSALGISYFDFRKAFQTAATVPYPFFVDQWIKNQFQIFNNPDVDYQSMNFDDAKLEQLDSLQAEPERIEFDSRNYRSFLNIKTDRPLILPYYLKPDDFGFGGLLGWQSPLRLHKLLFTGILSIPSVRDKSFFYTSYINNSLGPRIEASFKHYTSASGWLDLNVQTSNVAALSALWKIDALSRENSNWYAGLMLRYLKVDYHPQEASGNRSTEVAFDNRYTTQTDARFALAWRRLTPTPHNLVHPLNGLGFRLTLTGSGPLFNEETQYARFHFESFVLLPAFGKQRLYLYGAAALDISEPIGADYLAFSDRGDYQLPGPQLLGSIGRSVEGYIRGYDYSVAGERFVWGTLEYRIPLILNPDKLLFGILPFSSTAAALFMDGGIMDGARTFTRNNFREIRLSIGAELKSSLMFKDFHIVFKGGIAQALDQSLSPNFYFTIQPAIPF